MPDPSTTPGAVFLSYASQDAEAARRIAEALRAAGLEVWFDQSELRGGDAWDAKIRSQIAQCALFVPIVSATTQARREAYFRLEWKLAEERTHLMAEGTPFLLPVTIDATTERGALVPKSFLAVQWTKLPGGETPPAFAERIKRLLAGEDAPLAAPTPGSAPAARGRATPAWLRHGWLAVGLVFALVYALRPFWAPARAREAAPSASTPGAEVDRIVATLRPDEWTRADFDAIMPTLDRLVHDYPERSEVWALRSIAHSTLVIRNLDSGTKPLEIGREAAERAARLAPDSPLAELSIGMNLTAMVSRGGDNQAAAEHIRRALARLPVSNLTRYAELTAYWLGYQMEGTDRCTAAWLAAEPQASFPAWIAAQSMVARRRFADTVRYAELAAKDPDVTGTRSLVTLFEACYYLRADLPAARAALDRITGAQRAIHRVVASRYLLAMAERRFDQALLELAQTPSSMLLDRVYHGPKALLAAQAYAAAGREQSAREQFVEADRILRQELAQDADNAELRAAHALTLACLDRKDDAHRELDAVEPLLSAQAASVYTGQQIALVAQARAVLGETEATARWLRRLLEGYSTHPFTPASLRLDPRFARCLDAPPIQALLTEFARLDPVAAAPAPDDKSVAVLAFANLSDDKGNEYFSDGISEELLNVLARVPGLKVSARTSSFHFKGKDTPIPEIARQLGVAYVVEGSVRKAGDKVRITAQLIKAADGFHLWSDTFTRDLKDIFAVQDEIAGLIAQNLRAQMTAVHGRATPAPEVYALLLQARHAAADQTNDGARRAIALYGQAVARDPQCVDAWAETALDYVQLGRFGGLPTADGMREARLAARRALDLDPGHPLGLLALAWVQRTNDRDWRGAVESFRRALAAEPENVTIMSDAAVCFLNVGNVAEAARLAARAAERDPLNARAQWSHGVVLLMSGQAAAAADAYARAVALAPAADEYHSHLARALALTGRYAEAMKEVQLEPNERYRLVALATAQLLSGDRAGGDRSIQQLADKYGDTMAGYLSNLCAMAGRADDAFRWLERGYDSRDAAMAWVKTNTHLVPLHTDPRWEPFLRKMGLADDQLK